MIIDRHISIYNRQGLVKCRGKAAKGVRIRDLGPRHSLPLTFIVPTHSSSEAGGPSASVLTGVDAFGAFGFVSFVYGVSD